MAELVSVVVPIYNVENYLDRCITSIINQTYENLEIILVDDGSPDRCPQICDSYAQKDPRIKVIHKQNEGLGMARNTGIDNATGDYICFFDSDDSIEPDTIEACVTVVREHEADLVIFGHDNVTPDMVTLETHIPHPPKQLFTGEEITKKLLPMSIHSDLKTGDDWGIVPSAWNKLYSMDLIRRSGWRFVSEREIISEDYYSLTQLHGYLSRVYVIQEAFYHYTVNNKSLSRSFKPDRFERIKGFYEAMVSLSEKMELPDVLDQPIKAITFGFTIGTMKQIISSGLPLKARFTEMRKVVRDDCLQKIVRTTCYAGCNIQKKLLYTAVKHKLVRLCYLLVYLKNKSET